MSRLRFAVALAFYFATAALSSAGLLTLADGGDGKTVILFMLTGSICLIIAIVLTVIP
jgi:hypothetical protein